MDQDVILRKIAYIAIFFGFIVAVMIPLKILRHGSGESTTSAPTESTSSSNSGSQSPTPNAPGPKAEKKPVPMPTVTAATAGPGLIATFYEAGQSTAIDMRTQRMAALYVADGQPPASFVKPGPFSAKLEGIMEIADKGDYEFSAKGNGSVKITIEGKVVLEGKGDSLDALKPKSLTLSRGPRKLLIEYTSPDKGAAQFRLFWKGEEFPAEPVPPMVFKHEAGSMELGKSLLIREGRELVTTMRCFLCHLAPESVTTSGMPELGIDAPTFAAIGTRLNADWMAAWIHDPRALRPESSMPKLLHAGSKEDAAHLAAYLATLDGEKVEAFTPSKDKEVIKQGAQLFGNLGCIGCHTLPDFNGTAEASLNRTPLAFVQAKWKPGALKEFLQQPSKHYNWIRMPNFKFSKEEVEQLIAFLFDQKGKTPEKATGDVAKGKQLVSTKGCMSCHALPAEKNEFSAKDFADLNGDAWTKGCMAEKIEDSGNAPWFYLSAHQRDAMRAFVASKALKTIKQDSMAEFTDRRITALRCTACHERDTQDDTWTRVNAEVKQWTDDSPEVEFVGIYGEKIHTMASQVNRPRLTWTGDKLKPEWISDFIEGKIAYRARPWLKARMPNFPSSPKQLAQGFAEQHGMPIVTPKPPAPDKEKVANGKKLVLKTGGFGCVDCHDQGKYPAIGVFEVRGVNFGHVGERLQKEFYLRWMMNPLRVDPDSKMTKFPNDEGKTSLTEFYGGDGAQQFDAIWNYFLEGKDLSNPEE